MTSVPLCPPGDLQQPQSVALYLSPMPLQAATIFHATGETSAATEVMGPSSEIQAMRTRIASLDATGLADMLENWRRVSAVVIQGLHSDRADRHLRRLVDRFRNQGARGLLNRTRERGWSGSHKQDSRSSELLDRVIEEEFLKPHGVSARAVFGVYQHDADEMEIPRCEQYTYRSVARRIAAIRKHKATYAREGARAALKFRPATTTLSPMGPPNGLAPFGCAHIDHTKADALVFDPETGKWERPWVSFMVDGYSGAVLAFVVWFRSPQTETVLALLVDCLKRHGCLPWKIRCDHGTEFFSQRVQEAMAALGVSLAYRPADEPRSGSPVEESFDGANQRLFHCLTGTTKNRKAGRELTKAMKPEEFATWRMDCFIEIVNRYVVAQNQAPRETKPSPMDMIEAYVAQHGSHCREWSWLSEDLLRRLCAHDTTDGLTRIVSKSASVRSRACEYTADELQDLVGQEVHVFVDRLDARFAYVDHPTTGQRITCRAVTSAVAYARDAAVANQVVEQRLSGADARRSKAAEIFGELLDVARSMELWQSEWISEGLKPTGKLASRGQAKFDFGDSNSGVIAA